MYLAWGLLLSSHSIIGGGSTPHLVCTDPGSPVRTTLINAVLMTPFYTMSHPPTTWVYFVINTSNLSICLRIIWDLLNSQDFLGCPILTRQVSCVALARLAFRFCQDAYHGPRFGAQAVGHEEMKRDDTEEKREGMGV